MQVKILGCSGGVGGNLRTTSLLVGEHALIDAGTGAADLSLETLLKIDHIFVTHAHLDHIAAIPLLLDSAIGLRDTPVTVHAHQETIAALKTHIFNWKIWPDFNQIPNPEQPFLQYAAIAPGQSVALPGVTITALPANHVVPALGYQVNGGAKSLVFTGDTGGTDDFWQHVNQIENLEYLIVETAFRNADAELARISKHLCPETLASELAKARLQPQTFITHLKPGEGEMIMQEIAANPATRHCQALLQHQLFDLN
ncbi:MAG TPA: 3',5'-cyclic-nucleotide phosphodiesterase [Methylophilus sp.]|nr:3',5'-cyclic-nucleotide phosphodiesterase [Methylophilus sp.]HQQ32857.1 3',5'-cyclic-nucleotide phosphodiesterase [Methylophilus sp.]